LFDPDQEPKVVACFAADCLHVHWMANSGWPLGPYGDLGKSLSAMDFVKGFFLAYRI
jgi:hypothetical protein